MTLSSRLQDDLTQAIRDRDELRRDTLRMVIAAAYNTQKAAGRELSDDEVIQVLTREVKTRRESFDAFTAGDRPEAAAKEKAEIDDHPGIPARSARRDRAGRARRAGGRRVGRHVATRNGQGDGRADAKGARPRRWQADQRAGRPGADPARSGRARPLMLARSASIRRFTRSDASRLVGFGLLLVLALGGVLAIDALPGPCRVGCDRRRRRRDRHPRAAGTHLRERGCDRPASRRGPPADPAAVRLHARTWAADGRTTA